MPRTHVSLFVLCIEETYSNCRVYAVQLMAELTGYRTKVTITRLWPMSPLAAPLVFVNQTLFHFLQTGFLHRIMQTLDTLFLTTIGAQMSLCWLAAWGFEQRISLRRVNHMVIPNPNTPSPFMDNITALGAIIKF